MTTENTVLINMDTKNPRFGNNTISEKNDATTLPNNSRNVLVFKCRNFFAADRIQ